MTATNGAGAAGAASASDNLRPPHHARQCQCGARLAASNRSGVCQGCANSKTCPDCGCRVSYNATRCRTHANAIYNSDPVSRAAKSATMRRRFADPSYRDAHIALSRAGTARLMEQPGEREKRAAAGRANGLRNLEATRSPEVRARAGRAISATKLAHIPDEYRGMYRELKPAGYTAAEREQMVLEQRERDRAEAGQRVANAMTRQRIRAEREKAQAY
ncbi:hypothetical protein ASE70_14945 [Sphingomonas sp. Leaf22]|uniref:hypothetical protein n=1 Tax=Sphingomonas sp. Leaf22 TaxID=1735687 RepID=UPI0007019256|nr:hypothetical protein [Sphingomonas sp. Leaf22]KQM92209.1 hypothetical protein ASE70_14945 [Sphingomonas sp. Leaf22]